ncbi:MAG TPA: SdrD B-like domain-containing protein [Cellvibrionaceae bacterium]
MLFSFSALLLATQAQAQNANFAVTVNTGPTPPNSDTVYPGEATSLRITLSNNSTIESIPGVNFDKALPTTATGGLWVSGPAEINGPGCGGTLNTTEGEADISLSGLTVPVRVDSVPNSGECYLDIPVVAWSSNGASTSHSYALNPGDVGSDTGANTTGGPQAITVRSVSRPTWSKGFPGGNGLAILGGSTTTLRINVNNPDNNVSLSNFSFTDVFPTSGGNGAVIEPTGTPATGTCIDNAGASVNLTQGVNAQVEVVGGTLAPNSSCSLDVEIRARHTNGSYQVNVQNSIDNDSFSSDEGLQPSGNANRNITVRSPLGVTKSFAASPVASGVASTFTIVLSNSGTTPLTVDSFEDDPVAASPYEDRMTVTNVANSCVGDQVIAGDAQGFAVSNFDIPAGGSCTLTVTFVGETPDSDLPTSYTNNIPEGAVSIAGEPGIISQARSASVIVADRLRVLKSRSPNNVAPGNPVRYQVTVQNYSDTPAANVTVADQLQNGATLLTNGGFAPELTPACGALGLNGRVEGDDDLLFTIPTLPARTGSSSPGACTITFWAMIDPTTTLNTNNQIAICAVQINGDSNNCNGSTSQQVTANYQAVIALAKTFDGQTNRVLTEGEVSRLRIRVSNYSDNPLTTVAISDTLPTAGAFAQLRVASPANAGSSCGGTLTAVPGSTSVSLNNGSVAARNSGTNTPGTCQIEVDVVGPAGVYNNTADVSAIQTNADGSELAVNTDASANLTYNDALAASKGFSPASVGPGGESLARITLSNLDTTRPITGIRVEDNLPVDMFVASPVNAYSTCNGPTVITAAPGGSSVVLEGASLAPGATCELLFNVTVEGTSNWTNTLLPGQITADGGLLNRTNVSATLNYQAPDVPVISKAISPGVVAPGESARLTINITNASQPVSNLRLSDYFTEDGLATGVLNSMTIALAPAASTSCPGGIISAEPGGTSISVAGAMLDADAACEVSVNVTSTRVGTITNTIPLESIITNEGATNTTTFAQSTLSTTNSVGVSKSFTPAVVTPGTSSRLRVTIYNTLEQSLVGFNIVDNLPADLLVTPDPNPFSNCGGAATITWPDNTSVELANGTLGPMVNGVAASCYLEIDVAAAVEGSYLNNIPANTITVDGEPVSHPPTDATLEVREHIVVNKAIDGLTLDAGNPVGFTTGSAIRLPGVAAPLVIRLENPNDLDLTQVTFTDVLPEGLVVATVPDAQTTCDQGVVAAEPSAQSIVLTGANLAATGEPGSICTVTVNVLSNIPGTYINEIPAGGVTSFEEVENEEPTQAELIITEPGGLGKAFDPPVIPPSGVSVLTISIANNNEANMVLSAPLVDNLPAFPAQMTVATPNGLVNTCTGAVTAAAGSTSVTLANGAVIPPGGCRIEVNVTAPDAGDYVNNFPIGALQSNFGPNEEPVNTPLLVSTLGYISGKVFLDNQAIPDGVFIPGDSTPIAGNPIELRSGGSCAGTLLDTALTDSQGNYLFAELPAGTYSVCQPTQPVNTLNSVTTEGVIVPYNGSTGTVGSASNPTAITSQIVGIVLNDSGDEDEVSGSPENNFSEVLPASIAGNVFFDRNNDGVIDTDEPGIGNVTVTLTGPSLPEPRVTQTAADGSYSFTDLPPGEYTVTETHPAGWVDGIDTAGSHGGDDSVDDIISNITLAPGDDAIEYNFGEYLEEGIVDGGLTLSLNSFCNNDTPWVSYQLLSGGVPFGDSAPLVTISWLTPDGRLAEQLSGQPASGTLLWPGAAVDGTGNPVAWPGWEIIDGQWVQVPDDRRPDMRVRIQVNPTGEGEVSYPPATPQCAAQPPGTYTVSALPTLSNWATLMLGLLLILTGFTFHYRRNSLNVSH